MDQEQSSDLTELINSAKDGDETARNRLFAALHGEFHRLAEAIMRREHPGHTLQATALVNEAVIRLISSQAIANADHRRYLIGAAARSMRQILVDHSRKRAVWPKHGDRVPLDDAVAFFEEQDIDIVELDEAIQELTDVCERAALVVVLRYFAGQTVRQVADVLGVPVFTVESDWRFARAWLKVRLGSNFQ